MSDDTDLTRRIEAIIREPISVGVFEGDLRWVGDVARNIASLIAERETSTARGEPDGFWMIYFYEAGLPPEIFSGDGAEVAAWMRFEQVSIGYNCRLLAPVGALVSPTPEVVRMARQQGYDDGVAAATASARREALEEAAVVASAKLHIPKGTYIEPEFDNYQGGLRDAARTIAVRLRAMAKHGGVE